MVFLTGDANEVCGPNLALLQEHSSYISTGPNGEVYAAWWNLANKIMFARSLDGGRTWQRNIIARQAVPPGPAPCR